MTLPKFSAVIVVLLCLPSILLCLDSLNYQLLNYAIAHPPNQAMKLEEIASALSIEAQTEQEKAEIAAYWIIQHIEFERNPDESIEGYTDLNKIIQHQEAGRVVFPKLYRQLCRLMGLECYIVPGYVRRYLLPDVTYAWEPIPKRTPRVWNAVKIDNKYFFVDFYKGGKIIEEDKELDADRLAYVLIDVLADAEPFTNAHLSADPRWQMREYPISLEVFCADITYEEMHQRSFSGARFDYKSAIAEYEAANEDGRRLMRIKSIYEFNPSSANARELADLYYGIAYKMSQEPYSDQKMMDARRNYQWAIEIYRELEQNTTVKQLLEQAQQGITYVNYRLEHKH